MRSKFLNANTLIIGLCNWVWYFSRKDFFGLDANLTGPAVRVTVSEGQAIILPAGVPHIVRTLESAIVRGINFIPIPSLRKKRLLWLSGFFN